MHLPDLRPAWHARSVCQPPEVCACDDPRHDALWALLAAAWPCARLHVWVRPELVKLERLLPACGINPDNSLGTRFGLQAVEQSARCLTAEWRVGGKHDDDLTGLFQRSAEPSHQCGGRPATGGVLCGEDHRTGHLAYRADDNDQELFWQRRERVVKQRCAVDHFTELVRREAL